MTRLLNACNHCHDSGVVEVDFHDGEPKERQPCDCAIGKARASLISVVDLPGYSPTLDEVLEAIENESRERGAHQHGLGLPGIF